MAPKIKFQKPKQDAGEKDASSNDSTLGQAPQEPSVSPTAVQPSPPPLEMGETIEEPKRGRGRPKGSTTKRKGSVIPLDVEPPGVDESEEEKPKRGRPKKSSAKFWSKEQLANQLMGWHQFLNIVFPGTAISQSSADMLANAMTDVAEAYDLKISPKVTSVLGLVAAVGIVEVPVLLTIRKQVMVKQATKKAMRKVQNDTVSPPPVAQGEPSQDGGVQIVDESGINYGNGVDSSKGHVA